MNDWFDSFWIGYLLIFIEVITITVQVSYNQTISYDKGSYNKGLYQLDLIVFDNYNHS